MIAQYSRIECSSRETNTCFGCLILAMSGQIHISPYAVLCCGLWVVRVAFPDSHCVLPNLCLQPRCPSYLRHVVYPKLSSQFPRRRDLDYPCHQMWVFCIDVPLWRWKCHDLSRFFIQCKLMIPVVKIDFAENCSVLKCIDEVFGDGCLQHFLFATWTDSRFVGQGSLGCLWGFLPLAVLQEVNTPLDCFMLGDFLYDVTLNEFVNTLFQRLE